MILGTAVSAAKVSCIYHHCSTCEDIVADSNLCASETYCQGPPSRRWLPWMLQVRSGYLLLLWTACLSRLANVVLVEGHLARDCDQDGKFSISSLGVIQLLTEDKEHPATTQASRSRTTEMLPLKLKAACHRTRLGSLRRLLQLLGRQGQVRVNRAD